MLLGLIESLIGEIYEPRGLHTLGQWKLVDIDIIIRVFVKISLS